MKFDSKKVIILVEDNVDFAETVKEFIEDATPYRVLHFMSGRSALAYLDERSSGVTGILSDLMMKDMDGIDFLSRIRKSSHFSHLPLIFISGTEPMVFQNLLKPHQFAAFLQKPIDFVKMVELIKNHFEATQKSAA
ncbi:MAG: response regulator [Proteobacteria bacterium]|jgi:CheY-like chemotaxis protein|nr:response regulator [Pseudomonadota bacterium]